MLDQVAQVALKDTFAPVLAERLAAASRAGIDAATLVREAADTRPLPDDHAAAALWWRVAEHLAPAVDNDTGPEQLLSTAWVPALAEQLGPDRAEAMQTSTWWPALVTTVEHALQRGWSLDGLAATAPAPGTDVDDAAAMTWTISTLLDDPTHLHQAQVTHEDDHELAADTLEPHPASVQPTDAEYQDLLDRNLTATTTAPEAPENLEPDQVNAGLALAAQCRRLMGPLDPTDADLQRAYDRAIQAQEWPVSVERLAQVNAIALDFYQRQFTAGGWARDYLADRFGQDVAGHPHVRPGYAPGGWTRLLDHLRTQGVSNTELQATGLATSTKDGRLIDRFRDRVVFPITDPGGRVLGLIGRRNPSVNEDAPHAGPKYLNTPTTPLFSKGNQLYAPECSPVVAPRCLSKDRWTPMPSRSPLAACTPASLRWAPPSLPIRPRNWPNTADPSSWPPTLTCPVASPPNGPTGYSPSTTSPPSPPPCPTAPTRPNCSTPTAPTRSRPPSSALLPWPTSCCRSG